MPTLNLSVSSDSANGAKDVRLNGSSFEINLEKGLGIPREAKNIHVSVEEAKIWFVDPNIDTTNQTISMTFANTSAVTAKRTILIPVGLYDPTNLENQINTQFQTEHSAPAGLIKFIANESTGRLAIRLNYISTLHFADAGAPLTLLGFPATDLVDAVGSTVFAGNADVQFQTLEHYEIHSDLIRTGLPVNGVYRQIIAEVPVNVKIGLQIQFAPFRPLKINDNKLAGLEDTSFRFWLTDSNGAAIDTQGEVWSARILITWD